MTATCTCPTCGQPMREPRVPVDALIERAKGRASAPLIRALVEAYPRRLSAEQLILRIWADDPNGGPLNAPNAFVVTVRHVNNKLKPAGWMIESPRRGGYFGYRLAPLEA